MKQAVVIFIAAIIFVSSMSNAVLVFQFKLNQAEIERLHCVNKATPKKQCHGKCHLAKQLVENNTHNEQPSPLSHLEEAYKINFFHQQIWKTTPISIAETGTPPTVGTANFLSRLFGKSLFQPPDIQLLNC